MDKAIVAFLLDLVSGDMDKGSEDLLAVCKGYPMFLACVVPVCGGEDLLAICKGYPRDQKYVLGVRPFCTLAHGLYCLAQPLLSEDAFQTLKTPEYRNFLPDFALWRREHSDPDLSLWFRYSEGMELFNDIYSAPPARLFLKPPAPGDKKQEWFADGVKWVDKYVDELWDMGIAQE